MREMRILDGVDQNINADQPMLQGLTNGGPAALGIPMNLPAYEPQQNTTSGVFGSTPALLQDLRIEDDDEWSDTDPMSFEDDQIFEHSPFLGIRIGKKAKAKGAAKKAARIEKRAARKAAKNANIQSIGADSVWKQPDSVTVDNYNPLGVAPTTEAPAMLDTINNPANTFALQNLLKNANTGLADGLTGFENEVSGEYDFDPYQKRDNTPPKEKDNNTVLYAAIGAAVLIILVIVLKRK